MQPTCKYSRLVCSPYIIFHYRVLSTSHPSLLTFEDIPEASRALIKIPILRIANQQTYDDCPGKRVQLLK